VALHRLLVEDVVLVHLELRGGGGVMALGECRWGGIGRSGPAAAAIPTEMSATARPAAARLIFVMSDM
jgi:hypothetical protein